MLEREHNGTIVFDITTSSKWSGVPVGIVRVERELARRASNEAGARILFSLYDQDENRFFRVKEELVGKIIQGKVAVTGDARPPVRSFKSFLRAPRVYLVKVAVDLLARQGVSPLRRWAAALLLKWLRKPKDDEFIGDRPGSIARIPFRAATLGPIVVGPDTIVVSCGLDWEHKELSAIYRAKKEMKFRYAAICYDVIPWKFPHLVPPGYQQLLMTHFAELSWAADTVLCISECTARDYVAFCDHFLIPRPKIAVFPLGSDVVSDASTAARDDRELLPNNLQPGQFILCTSTIEPRKNHRLLYNVWQRMTLTGQNAGIKLVWVGRRGWMTDDLIDEIALNPFVKDSLCILEGVSDEALQALYRHCLFTVFPSFYEGYGLPVAESLNYGKVCVAARTGSIPEIAGELIPLLDPLDTMTWLNTMSRLISDVEYREGLERRLRAEYVAPTWERAAHAFFAQIRSVP